MRLGRPQDALNIVEAILERMQTISLKQTSVDPIRVYVTCVDILQSVDSQRAATVREKGFAFLDAVSAEIANSLDRLRYRTSIPSHRRLLAFQ